MFESSNFESLCLKILFVNYFTVVAGGIFQKLNAFGDETKIWFIIKLFQNMYLCKAKIFNSLFLFLQVIYAGFAKKMNLKSQLLSLFYQNGYLKISPLFR